MIIRKWIIFNKKMFGNCFWIFQIFIIDLIKFNFVLIPWIFNWTNRRSLLIGSFIKKYFEFCKFSSLIWSNSILYWFHEYSIEWINDKYEYDHLWKTGNCFWIFQILIIDLIKFLSIFVEWIVWWTWDEILQVSCFKYGMVPLVMGLILQTVKVTLSPGFDHHRIQLSFGTSYIPKTPTQVIVLNGVVDLKVFDWWHPCYPHQDVISSTILEETTESWDFVPSDYLTV